MASLSGIIDRARLEIGDRPTPFVSEATADGTTRTFDLPESPLSAGSKVWKQPLNGPAVLLTEGLDYVVDVDNGRVTFTNAPADGATITTSGSSFKYFTDSEWLLFAQTSTSQHLHNRQGVTLANLPPVEDYPVALLTAIQALYVLVNDAAAQIDVSTPEGVSIPRHQRYDQLMQMLIARQEQYNKLAMQLNVGLGRIEMMNLRRVSRTTGRLVPVYQEREIDDTRMPNRQFIPIDLGGGSDVVHDLPATLDISFRAGNHYELPLDFSFNLTGYQVFAAVRRYPESSRLREFTILVTDAALGKVTLSLKADETLILPHQCFWDLFLRDPTGNETPYMAGRVEVERARAQLSQGYGG